MKLRSEKKGVEKLRPISTTPAKKPKYKVSLRTAHPTGDFMMRYGWQFERDEKLEAWKPLLVAAIPEDKWWKLSSARWFTVEEVK